MRYRSANPPREAPNPGTGAPMWIEKCSPTGGAPMRGRVGTECGNQCRSHNPDGGVPVGLEKLLSQAEERGNGGIEH